MNKDDFVVARGQVLRLAHRFRHLIPAVTYRELLQEGMMNILMKRHLHRPNVCSFSKFAYILTKTHFAKMRYKCEKYNKKLELDE